MKDVRLLLAGILLTFCMTAQSKTSQPEYHPFAEDGKIWKTQVGGIKENIYGNSIDGDTVINGEKWKKVYNYHGFPEFNYTYYSAIRDVDKRVYAIAKGSTKPRLLYDFGLKVGDIVKCGIEGNAFGCLLEMDEPLDTLLGFAFASYLKVEHIDTIITRGIQHRRFILSLLDAFQEYYRNENGAIIDNVIWVEGVGSGAGPFSPWMPLPPRNSILQSCEVDRTCIFGYPDFYEIETSDAINSPQTTIKKKIFYYDLSGRRVVNPKRGLYIQGGERNVKGFMK